MATPSRLLANKKFREKKYDVITFEADKGNRAIYKKVAADLGLSLRMLFQNSVEEYAQNHAGEKISLPAETSAKSEPEKKLTASERRLVEMFARLPEKTRTKFAGLLENVADLVDVKGGD